MLVTGDSAANDRVEGLLEDLIEVLGKVLDKKDAPVITVEQPAIVFPEQKGAIVNIPEPKNIINIPEAKPKKPYAVRCKIHRDSYGGIDYIDITPIQNKL